MEIQLADWIETLQRDYLARYLPGGGSAVKFAVVPPTLLPSVVIAEVRQIAKEAVCAVAEIDAAKAKISAIDQIFFSISRQMNWDMLAKVFVRTVLDDSGFQVPEDVGVHDFRSLARQNGRTEAEFRDEMHDLLNERLFQDFALAREFRIAMVRLCEADLEPEGAAQDDVDAIRAWLRGELRLLSRVKPTGIFQKIARHNARDMLISLSHWVRIVGWSGLVVTVDIGQLFLQRRDLPLDALRYTPMVMLDAYEVFREFIDDTDQLEGCLIVVVAPRDFLEDQRRGLERYDPLKFRIWDDVRDRRQANPLSSLIRIAPEPWPEFLR